MQWNVTFEFASLLILLLMLISSRRAKLYPNLKNKMFWICMWYVFSQTIVSILSIYSIEFSQSIPVVLNQTIQILFFLSSPLIAVLFFFYLFAVIIGDETNTRLYFWSVSIPYILYAVVVLANPFTGMLFSFSDTNGFILGDGYMLVYLFPAVYKVAMVIFIFANRKKMKKETILILSSFPIISLVFLILQMFFPAIILAGFGSTLALIIMGISLRNDEFRFANKELVFQNDEKTKRASELILINKKLNESLEFQNIVSQIATQFINVEEDNYDRSIDAALKIVGEYIQVDRMYVFLYHFAEGYMENSFEWCNQGINPEIDQLTHVPFTDLMEDWVDLHTSGKSKYIEDVNALPKDGKLFSILAPQSIKSLLTIPMMNQGECIGFVGFDSVKANKHYGDKELSLLQVISEVITNLLIKQNQHEKMLQAQQITVETKTNYETFFNNVEDFLFVLDEQGNILHINETVSKRLGFSIEELFGKSILIVHPVERREEAGRIVGEMLAGKSEFCPVPIVTKTGLQIPVETRVNRGFWSGKPVLFGVTKDITKIQLSEEKFSKLFLLNPSACGLSDLNDHRYIEVNDAFCNLFGFSKSEVIGKTAFELDIMTPQSYQDVFQKADSNGKIINAEVDLKAKNGVIKHVFLTSDNIFVQNIKYRFTAVDDFTERKVFENQLIASQEKVRQQETANNLAKTKFIEDMSHEIRTPLAGIFNSIYLLENTSLTTDQKEYVNIAHFSLESLSAIVNDVLDLSKIESGVTPLDYHLIDLEAEMVQLAKTHKSIALEKGLKFYLTYDYSIPKLVSIDQSRLRQVLMNLLINAIKFTETGHVTLQLHLLEKTTDFVTIRFSVIDSGIGIATENIPFLKDKFFQINSSKSTQEIGTGLGLPIVYELIHLLGGQLQVTSELEKGSDFSFLLHLAYADSPDATSKESLDGKRVLLAYGAAADTSRFKRLLASLNLTVTSMEISSLINKFSKPDLFDFIVFYPGDDAPPADLIKWIASVSLPKILIITTGSDFAIKRWGGMGFNHFLIPPFTRAFVQNVLLSKSETISPLPFTNDMTTPSRFHLLIVDDNRINRQSMTIILNKAGYMTSSAQNAFEALELIKSTRFDLLLIDIKMPGMNGFELTRLIREMGGIYANLLIVALTANSFQTASLEAAEAGMNGAITKPIKPAVLLEMIESYLENVSPTGMINQPAIHIPDELQVFDGKSFLERFGDTKELVRELIVAYLEDYRTDLDKIETAIALGNAKAITETTHYFIGSVSNVGAERLLWLANMMKNEAKKETLGSMKTLSEMMMKEAEICAKTMSAWLEERRTL